MKRWVGRRRNAAESTVASGIAKERAASKQIVSHQTHTKTERRKEKKKRKKRHGSTRVNRRGST
jgi:hypothetical protein